MIYDTVIIGAGPAGFTASIYASRAGLDHVILDCGLIPGGQILDTAEVENYPGIPGTTGFDLAQAFEAHAKSLGAKIVDARVIKCELEGDIKRIFTADPVTGRQSLVYEARTVIIASGAKHRRLGVKGEEELAGRGVSYCATCDGAFYKGKRAAVVGGGNSAFEDALFLSRICDKVTLIHRRQSFRADKVSVDRLQACLNVEFVLDSVVESIDGEGLVSGLSVRNVKTGTVTSLPAEAVFISAGIVPDTVFLGDGPGLSEDGYIMAGEDTKTSIPGVFAAGDVRMKPLRQIVTAAADGANAVHAAVSFLG